MTPFDFNKIQDFDDHINKSIPNYNVLLSMIVSLSEYFVVKDAKIYDLGCSTGKLLKTIDAPCEKIGYDLAELLPKEHGFYKVDLNKSFVVENACVVYSVFTMQFLDPSKRLNYIKTVYDGLNIGGAFIIAEKIFQQSGNIQEIFSFSHYDYKRQSFTSDEIIKKEKDLRFVMKPMLESDLLFALKNVGFNTISSFWQSFNFKAFIAIK